MSAQPAGDTPLITGAAAPRLRPAESPVLPTSERPSLQALPRVRHRRRGLVSGVIALIALALGAVLAVNIHVSNAQYELVQLQYEHQGITQHNEALSQQVQHLQTPQSLSDGAVGLGMVMPAAAGSFDLDTGEVAGDAQPADSSDRPSSFVATPVEPGQEVAAPNDVSEHLDDTPSGILGSGALNTLAVPSAGQNGEDTPAEDAGADPRDLNGGTIPAPSLD